MGSVEGACVVSRDFAFVVGSGQPGVTRSPDVQTVLSRVPLAPPVVLYLFTGSLFSSQMRRALAEPVAHEDDERGEADVTGSLCLGTPQNLAFGRRPRNPGGQGCSCYRGGAADRGWSHALYVVEALSWGLSRPAK